jgi:hypothetical protein
MWERERKIEEGRGKERRGVREYREEESACMVQKERDRTRGGER